MISTLPRTERDTLLAELVATGLRLFEAMAMDQGQDKLARAEVAASIAFGAYAKRELEFLHLALPGIDPVVDPDLGRFRFRAQRLLEQAAVLHSYGMAAWSGSLVGSDLVAYGRHTVSLVQAWDAYLALLDNIASGHAANRDEAHAWLAAHGELARHVGE